MKDSRLLGAVCACAMTLVSVSVNAMLVERLGGLAYYDTDADLTWLADANAAAGSSFELSSWPDSGLVNWTNANNWVAQLNIDGVTGWRLPSSLNSDGSGPCGSSLFNCMDSELGNMFYNVLGGTANSSITTSHNGNYDLFSNIQAFFYWSSTDVLSNKSAWVLYFDSGLQADILKSNNGFAWAVHDGDVGAVPVPASVWLFGSGLLGLIGITKKNKA